MPSMIHTDILLRKMDKDTFLTGVEMSRYLDALIRAKSIQKLSVPMLLGGTWTAERLNKLRIILTDGANRFRRVRFTLQDFRPSDGHIRNELWRMWKEFIGTSTTLQELEVSNLTDEEHIEFMELVQSAPQLKEVRLNGHIWALNTLTMLVRQLSFFRIKSFLNFALLVNGKELNIREVDCLAKAVAKNYITEGLDIICADLATSSCADFKAVYPAQAKMINTITSLNKAGRCYLLEDSHNVEQGARVLSRDNVNTDLDSIFYHLSENTFLCQQGNELQELGCRC